MSNCGCAAYPAALSGPYAPRATLPQPYYQFNPLIRKVPGFWNAAARQPVITYASPQSTRFVTLTSVEPLTAPPSHRRPLFLSPPPPPVVPKQQPLPPRRGPLPFW